MTPSIMLGIGLGVVVLLGTAVLLLIRARNMQYWLGPYVTGRFAAPECHPDDVVDVFIAICDHWEPACYGASHQTALQRVQRWREEYPRLFDQFRDANDRPPQYTFFFPQDEYHPAYLDGIAPLCEAGFGDVDVHLHHDNDSPQQLQDKLEEFKETLHSQHGLLRRDPVTGEIVYGFIHGNWALCNSRPDGHCCGVDQELTVLLETGCYADFTMPSAPSPTQTRIINSLYYAIDRPGERKSHNSGVLARVGQRPPKDHLLMIQGPLCLDWNSRKFGLIPRIENGDLHGGRVGSARRLQLWIDAGVTVAGQPNWRFVKLHTHGCKDENINDLLGPPMQQFYRELQQLTEQQPNLRLHFVTAWEMAQLVHQAECGAAVPRISKPQHMPTGHSTLNFRNGRVATSDHGAGAVKPPPPAKP